MKRDAQQLAGKEFDILVVGGGVYGAAIARDAALRGLAVALIEKGDFGEATSANSLKIVHGGLRYLQDGDLKLVRRMIRERMAFMRIAPHLVHPLPCVMPTYSGLTRSKPVMAAALMLNDLAGFDRNLLDDPEKHLPNGTIISRSECLGLLPGLADRSITGGALWHDAQMHNSERLTLSFVLSAERSGGIVANYVGATGFLRRGDRVTGVKARDELAGEELEIRARVVVVAAGPWVDRVLGLPGGEHRKPKFQPSRAMNLVTRQLIPRYAAGVLGREPGAVDGTPGHPARTKLMFIAPWRNRSIIGTTHLPYHGDPDALKITEAEIDGLLEVVNEAYPTAALRREDVYSCHLGLLPAANGAAGEVKLVRQGRVHDHRVESGVDGLLSVVGVKYTMARLVAEQAVDLVFRKLGRQVPKCTTDVEPVVGGDIGQFDRFLATALKNAAGRVDEQVVRHLVLNYGSEHSRLLDSLDKHGSDAELISESAEVIKTEVRHAAREEMALKLSDVIMRRTELGSAGMPDERALRACADILAEELGWNEARTEREIAEVRPPLSLGI